MDSVVQIFSGYASKTLAQAIATSFGTKLGQISLLRFSDGEFQPSYEETVRGSDVFIIQSTMPPSENLMELLLMIDAAKRASAKNIVAVVPYFGWARQDRKDKPRVPIGAKLAANLLSAAGATRIMTMDLHADQIQGFFEVPVDHLYASTIFVPYIKKLGLDNLVIASPDMGGSKRANVYAKYLNCEMVICYKHREKANEVDDIKVIGNIEGKNIILIDDMIDTAGTLTKAADMLFNNGAISVRAFCTHPILSGKAISRIENSKIKELVITDTIPLKQQSSKIIALTVSDLFANVIKNVHDYKSISSHFII